MQKEKMISFNKPYFTGNEINNIQKAISLSHLSGDGQFTKICHQWLEQNIPCQKALLTQSCTAALEMAALLIDIQAGDEVIMPSYTFTSTTNAFVLRGATPVFIDIREDTLNLNEQLIENAITKKTKAIVPVHYAGVACEMNPIMTIAKNHNLFVIEDAAQAVMSEYHHQSLGSIGDLGCYSFHDSKNIICGEGGALLINKKNFNEKAEIIREKGTNRSKFNRGELDKYTWVNPGSSYLPSEINAAFLSAQFMHATNITERRLEIWNYYYKALASLEKLGQVRRPIVPKHCKHNAHMFYLLLEDLVTRDRFIQHMKQAGISCLFHYIPLHSSPFGKTVGRVNDEMKVTEDIAHRLVRLPLWIKLNQEQLAHIIHSIYRFFEQ